MKNSTRLWYFIIPILFFNILVYATKVGGEIFLLYVSDILPVITSFIAVGAVFLAFRKLKIYDYAKWAWFILLIGFGLNFLAESTYSFFEIVRNIDMDSYFPSVADYFWCLAYPFFFIGLAIMIFGYKKSGFPIGKTSVYVALAISTIVIFISILFFLILPILNDTETDAKSKIVYLIYPLGDILVVVLASIIMYITSLFGRNSISKPWKYIAFGFFCFAIADLIYSVLSWHDAYGNGNFIDIAWNLGYLSIGLAGLYQKELIDGFKEKE